MTKNFPLLNEIDQQIHSDKLDWNQNAFQTLLVRLRLNLVFRVICFIFTDIQFTNDDNRLLCNRCWLSKTRKQPL